MTASKAGSVSTWQASEGDSNGSSHRNRWKEKQLDAETLRWLAEDGRYFLHQSLSTPCLDVLAGCGGATLENLQGRSYLDFHGNSVHQVGFGNPRVVQAIKDQLDRLSFSPRRFTNLPAIELAKKLASIAPGDLNKLLFAPAGTLAVGMALKLARVYTGRFKTISMWDSFHGASLDAISVGGEALFRRGIGPLLPGAEHVPPAEPYRCLWNETGDCHACGLRCARYIDYVLEKEGDVAAVIAEPVRCTTVSIPPPGYWRSVREACDRHGALLIFDETAVCLGRTGRMFACEHFGVSPDILILGKGLGGGILPVAAVVAREDLDVGADMALGHYTHEKNPVACAAGLAAIEVLEEERLVERASALGAQTLRELMRMQAEFSLIGDVRGLGMLFCLELVRDSKSKIPAADEAERIMYECLAEGLSFKVSQGNCITLTPPLSITAEEMERALSILRRSIAKIGEWVNR